MTSMMDAFAMRLCVRAADQYERLLDIKRLNRKVNFEMVPSANFTTSVCVRVQQLEGETGYRSHIATLCGLHGQGIECRWRRNFSHPSRPALGSTQPHKRPVCAVNHSSPPRAEVKETVEPYVYSPVDRNLQ